MSELYRCFVQVDYEGDGLPTTLTRNAFYNLNGRFTEFLELKKIWSEGFCSPEMLEIHYLDDEDDRIPVETDEEFKELLKFAEQRVIKGMVVKIILRKKSPVDQRPVELKLSENLKSNKMTALKEKNDVVKNQAAGGKKSEDLLASSKEWRLALKDELKKEVMAEIKSELDRAAGFDPVPIKDDSEEDIEVLDFKIKDMRREKLLKKLEKLEKRSDGKVGHHLEKLELKKRKFLEKESRKVNREILPALTRLYDLAAGTKVLNVALHGKFNLPFIMSGIVTIDSSTVQECKEVGETFQHVWRIINDGTVPWKCNVELRHKWSSPGLVPKKMSIDCCPLRPGEEKNITVKFVAPDTVGPFISYWDFYHKNGVEWQPFGHYVSLNGLTKVSFAVGKDAEQQKINAVIDEVNSKIKRHLEVSLASSEIAAEMAREAANAARRAFSREQSATSSNQVSDAVQGLLKTLADHPTSNSQTSRSGGLDSGSDNEANNVMSEVVEDRDFVMVEIPSPAPLASANSSMNVKNVPDTSVNSKSRVEEKETNTADAQKKDEKSTENDLKVEVSKETTAKPVVDGGKQLNQPLSYPSLDPNINYPVFPRPAPSYPPLPSQYQAFCGKQFMPQFFPPGTVFHPNVSSGTVFPPPAPNVSSGTVFPPPPPNVSSGTVFPPPPPNVSSGAVFPPPPPNVSSGAVFPPPPIILQPAPALGEVKYNGNNYWKFDTPNSTYPPMNNQNHHNWTPFTYQSPYGHAQANHVVVNKTLINSKTQTTSSQQPQAAVPETPQAAVPETPQTVMNKEGPSVTQTSTVFEPTNAQDGSSTPHLPHETAENNQLTEETVQILPQGLVDGAINVASSAYSSVRGALNNLRPKDDKDCTEFDPVFENNMAQLMEMGFTNVSRNARLLKTYHNNIDQVINAIISNPGVDVLDID